MPSHNITKGDLVAFRWSHYKPVQFSGFDYDIVTDTQPQTMEIIRKSYARRVLDVRGDVATVRFKGKMFGIRVRDLQKIHA